MKNSTYWDLMDWIANSESFFQWVERLPVEIVILYSYYWDLLYSFHLSNSYIELTELDTSEHAQNIKTDIKTIEFTVY